MMWVTLTTLFLSFGAYYGNAQENPIHVDIGNGTEKVLNGTPSIPHSRNFIVQIFSADAAKTFVHGVILNPFTVLTVGGKHDHTTLAERVVAGKHYFSTNENTQQIRDICSISIHESSDLFINAYVLIHLSDPFTFNEYVGDIGLATSEEGKFNEECRIVGWGRSSAGTDPVYSEELLERPVKFKSPDSCKHVHPTAACIEVGACWFDWGASIICSHYSKTKLFGLVTGVSHDCKFIEVAWIPALPWEWLTSELNNAEKKCGSSEGSIVLVSGGVHSIQTFLSTSRGLYVRSAHVHSRDLTINLHLGSGYLWEETIVKLEGTIEEMKTLILMGFSAEVYLKMNLAIMMLEGHPNRGVGNATLTSWGVPPY